MNTIPTPVTTFEEMGSFGLSEEHRMSKFRMSVQEKEARKSFNDSVHRSVDRAMASVQRPSSNGKKILRGALVG